MTLYRKNATENPGLSNTGKIQILSKELIEKIAAGEVIERPVSVVKELIENSMDAGADEIKIYTERGGKRLIKVVDNGSGMDYDDLRLCVKRHSTSKINSIEDLFNITSLGFRGEALASISAVADLTIASKTEFNKTGIQISYDDEGRPKNNINIPMNTGTIVTVRNLFSRFPARLKFMKSDDIEFSRILDLIKNYSLAKPDISFHLYKGIKEIFNSPKSKNLLDKIYYVFGRNIAENLIPIDSNFGEIQIRGYVSKIGYTRKTKDYQVVFVNNRFVKSKEIIDAVYNGYPNKLFLDRHPIIILKLQIPPENIDVNIHPSKRKIKFKNEHELTRMVRDSISKSLSMYDQTIEVEAKNSKIKPHKIYPPEKTSQKILSVAQVMPLTPLSHSSHSPNPAVYETSKINKEFPQLKIIGQVNKTYILAENEEGLFIIDQHAGQERINYERYLKQLKDNAISVQKLLSPVLFEPNPTEKQTIKRYINLLKRYGYNIEEYGPKTYKIKTVPAIFNDVLPIQLFKDVLDEVVAFYNKEGKEINSISNIENLLDNRIATVSCKASIKAGHEMTIIEMTRLINNLQTCSNPFTCPHGRPTIIKIGWGEMEKKFKRSG